MKTIFKIISLACLLMCAAGCQKAVREHELFTYKIQGDSNSNLYPLEVSEVNEDVVIKLKKNASRPQIFSLDQAGRASEFNFEAEGKTLTVPAKFSHIVLRHAGDSEVGIIREKARN